MKTQLQNLSKYSRRIAFTLIEMLVVTAIISVLAALLMPSLKNAKDAAKRAGCMEHLHQVGVGLLMLANENDGWLNGINNGYADLPPTDPDGTCWLDPLHWRNALTNFLGKGSYQLVATGTNSAANRATGCPGRDFPDGFAPFGVNYNFAGNFFDVNGWGIGNPAYHSLTECKYGSRVILVCDSYWLEAYAMTTGMVLDSTTTTDLIYTGNLLWDRPMVKRHNGKGLNFVFVDGHGEWMNGYGATNSDALAYGYPAIGKWWDGGEAQGNWVLNVGEPVSTFPNPGSAHWSD